MPFINPIGSISCLFCGHKFHLSNALWRNLKGKQTLRDATKEKLNLPTAPSLEPEVSSSVFFGLRRFWVGRNVPDQWIKVCPECLLPLPRLTAAGYTAVERVAVIGGPASGKSNLIWALIKEAKMGCDSLGLTAELDDMSGPPDFRPKAGEKVWKEVYDNDIQAGRVINKTQVGETFGQVGPVAPLILRIRAGHRPLWHRLTHPWDDFRPVDLILFDRNGETFKDPAYLRQFASYVLSATAFIFLVDPEACDEFVPHFGTGTAVGPDHMDTVFDTTKKVLVDEGIVGETRRSSRDAVVVVTKADLLRDRFARDNPWSPWLHPPDFRRGFDMTAARSTSADIREYLRGRTGGGIVSKLESTFSKVHYFACSALGRATQKGDQPNSPEMLTGPAVPFRVLDPLLWLLSRRGYVKTAPVPDGLEEILDKDKANTGRVPSEARLDP